MRRAARGRRFEWPEDSATQVKLKRKKKSFYCECYQRLICIKQNSSVRSSFFFARYERTEGPLLTVCSRRGYF